MTTDAKLEWTMALDGGRLRVNYDVTNTTNASIYVVDKLVMRQGKKWARTDQVTVMNDAPGSVKFALAAISSDAPAAQLYTPAYREVIAGQNLHDSFTVDYPLTSWTPVGRTNPIAAAPKTATLMIQYFKGEPARCRLTDAGGIAGNTTTQWFFSGTMAQIMANCQPGAVFVAAP